MEAAGEARGRKPRTEGARDQQCRRSAARGAPVESGRLSAQRHRNLSRHGRLRRTIMRNQILLALAAASTLGLVAVRAVPVVYKLPEETAAFKPGPNLDVVQNNCSGCHSADYVNTQPRNAKSKKDFWQAEVTKMIKVYGAPIS